MKDHALNILRNALNDQNACFREGQWESIEELLNNKKMLVVERTGWGKSIVYFIATKILRERNKGPALLISPLLSLMRNQLLMAERIGIRAQTLNSTNKDKWQVIKDELRENIPDILLISPEQLANTEFMESVFATCLNNLSLFIIDEAHCISDWGHDFRPDYRRIVRILNILPENVPVLATTATANDRVVNDIISQLGNDLVIQRGSLVRKGLCLQNIVLKSHAERMAWIVRFIEKMPLSGIIYTLTIRDAERLTRWLKRCNINAEVYHSNVKSDDTDVSLREQLEEKLLNNEVKVLVATVALGMGFDKPDLGFVVHYQRPSSVVHYYQQVGRAGRAINKSYGVLLHCSEDKDITEYFIKMPFLFNVMFTEYWMF
jgi:ATP-dependent DNA helicase RecQ